MTEEQLNAFKRSAERRGISLEEVLSEANDNSSMNGKSINTSGCSSCRAAKEARLAAKIAKAIINPDADQQLIDNRLNICKGCPFLTKIVGIDQCEKCSCLISLKAKLKDEKCPEGKW